MDGVRVVNGESDLAKNSHRIRGCNLCKVAGGARVYRGIVKEMGRMGLCGEVSILGNVTLEFSQYILSN